MMEGPSEIITLSKIGGQEDARTLFNGANPSGRRRKNQEDEDDKNATKKSTDSVSAMFQVAPFSSFSELLDMQDFLIRNSKLEKFKMINSKEGGNKS